MTDPNLRKLLQDCRRAKNSALKSFFEYFYRYVMTIALRYSGNQLEAEEILNDTFCKIFSNLNHFMLDDGPAAETEIKRWIRRITVNTSIDYLRRNKNIRELKEIPLNYVDIGDDILSNISAEEILTILQNLPPQYRAVFNLYAIEGYAHHEIASMLGISEGTSKSNLFKARAHLKNRIMSVKPCNEIKNYGS
jgi:RNA polymerase sigma factor (sigma-70 family)